MGFTTGFTGGVTLTLSLAYLFVHTHQTSRLNQSNAIRSSTHALNSALSPVPPPPLPSRREIAAVERATISERFKDWWNGEIEGAVRSLQRTDWDALRDGAEESLMRLVKGSEWKREHSPEAWAQTEAARRKAEQERESVRQDLRKAGDEVASAAKGAGEEAEKMGQSLSQRARTAYDSARHKASDMADSAREGIHAAREKLDHATASAKARVHMAEEKWDTYADSKLLHASDVERALSQRYEPGRGEEEMKKSVDEKLEERLRATKDKDYGQLRGI